MPALSTISTFCGSLDCQYLWFFGLSDFLSTKSKIVFSRFCFFLFTWIFPSSPVVSILKTDRLFTYLSIFQTLIKMSILKTCSQHWPCFPICRTVVYSHLPGEKKHVTKMTIVWKLSYKTNATQGRTLEKKKTAHHSSNNWSPSKACSQTKLLEGILKLSPFEFPPSMWAEDHVFYLVYLV